MTGRQVLRVAILMVVAVLAGRATVTAETTKARVLAVDAGQREVRVDVAGQARTYRVNDTTLYGVLLPGRLVIITAELVAGRHTIVKAEPAAQEGRVTALNAAQGTASIQDNKTRSTATYHFDDGVSRNMAVGSTVNFDVEERPGRKVIVRWQQTAAASPAAALTDAGQIAQIDWKQARLTIDLESEKRREVFDLAKEHLLEGLKTGSRIAFEYQRRAAGNPVITSIR